MINKNGFSLFFTFNSKKFFFEEIIDYYVNIVKSIAMKINEDTDISCLKPIFIHII